jgi:hypothetical protein
MKIWARNALLLVGLRGKKIDWNLEVGCGRHLYVLYLLQSTLIVIITLFISFFPHSSQTQCPGFCWNDWVNSQVNRVHDLLDINTLRLARSGVDNTYKTMIWNLSQNVDRDIMGRFNLSGCLTPTGIPYVTNRGGPLVGEELLLLQGIPADDLLLTKESEKNLKDLSGNGEFVKWTDFTY